MVREREKTATDMGGHLHFLGRIYSFIGWLGIAGSGVLLFTYFSAIHTGTAQIPGGLPISRPFAVFLLTCWSSVLLSFSRDISGSRNWSTGLGGYCIGILNLLSIPIGTAIGTYTLWILIRYRRLQHMGDPVINS